MAKIRRDRQAKIILTFAFLIFSVYAVSLIYPFIWTFINSLKTNNDFFDNKLSLPKKWMFVNYKDTLLTKMVYNGTNLLGMFGNSFVLTVLCTIAPVASSTLAAYATARFKFRFCKVIFNIALLVQVIPTIGSLPATYKLVYDLNMANNFSLIWLLSAGGFSFTYLILYGCFSGISYTYSEAAKIDGAGNFRVFLQIILPQAKPVLISLTILAFIGSWNDYMTPFLYMDRYPTVSLGLYELQQQQLYASDMPILFAGIIMSMLPILIIFSVFQKSIMENTSAGGIKG